MPMTTRIILECGHSYSHEGIPSEEERVTEQHREPEVQCSRCNAPRRVVNAITSASL